MHTYRYNIVIGDTLEDGYIEATNVETALSELVAPWTTRLILVADRVHNEDEECWSITCPDRPEGENILKIQLTQM